MKMVGTNFTNRFYLVFAVIGLVLVVLARSIWNSDRLESKFVFKGDIKESYKSEIINYFAESPYYNKDEFKTLTVQSLGEGNCSNIKGRERLEVEVEGYATDTVYRVFIPSDEGVMKLCSSSNILDTVFHEVE